MINNDEIKLGEEPTKRRRNAKFIWDARRGIDTVLKSQHSWKENEWRSREKMMYPKEVKNLMRIVEELDYYGAIEVKSNFYGREEEKEEDSGYHSGYHSVSYHYDHDTKQWEKSSIEQYGWNGGFRDNNDSKIVKQDDIIKDFSSLPEDAVVWVRSCGTHAGALEFRFWRPHNKYVKREDLEDAVMP